MMHASPFLRRLSAILLLLIPVTTFAQFEDTIQHVAGPLNAGLGGAEFGSIYKVIILSFLGLVNVVGIFMVVRAGLSLTVAQDEGQLDKARKTIGAVAVALIIMNLAPRMAEAIFEYRTAGPDIITTEIMGMLRFFESLAAITAILFIIVCGIRAVTSYGSEDGTTHLKRAVLSVGAGLLLIALKMLILNAVVIERTPGGVMIAISKIVQAVLGLGAFVATLMLIYAGLLMILNLGKDEQYTRAKYLVLRVAIGLIVILTSLAIVRFVIG